MCISINSTAFAFVLALIPSGAQAIECVFDPARNSNVCRIMSGISCPKGGLGIMMQPAPVQAHFFLTKNALGHFVFKAPDGWKFIPGTEYAQFTDYKKKAKIVVHSLTEDTITCTWECTRSGSSDSRVVGYCGANARKL